MLRLLRSKVTHRHLLMKKYKQNNKMETKELIQNILDGDKVSADLAFNELLQDKVRTVLDIKKVELTANIYNDSDAS